MLMIKLQGQCTGQVVQLSYRYQKSEFDRLNFLQGHVICCK